MIAAEISSLVPYLLPGFLYDAREALTSTSEEVS
jgi:hypothetical protein